LLFKACLTVEEKPRSHNLIQNYLMTNKWCQWSKITSILSLLWFNYELLCYQSMQGTWDFIDFSFEWTAAVLATVSYLDYCKPVELSKSILVFYFFLNGVKAVKLLHNDLSLFQVVSFVVFYQLWYARSQDFW
jgi:hypothetical protein